MSKSLLDKRTFLDQVIRSLEESLRRLESGYSAARQAVLDTPHVMKSKREVSGIEASYLANGLARNMQERREWLRSLRALRLPSAPERVCLGSLVGVGPPTGSVRQLYFILPVCGGLEVPAVNGCPSVRIVTPGTAAARTVLGKGLGDEVATVGESGEPLQIRLLL